MKKTLLLIFAALLISTAVTAQTDSDSSGSAYSTDSDITSSSSSSSYDTPSTSSDSYSTSNTSSYSSGSDSYSSSSGTSSYSSSSASTSYESEDSYSPPSKSKEKSSKSGTPLSKLNITVSGDGNITAGQIVSGHEYGKQDKNGITKRWMNSFSARINVKSQPVDWYYTYLGLQVGSNFPITMSSVIQKESFKLTFKSFIPKAVGVFDLKFDNWGFLVESGLLEYTFNPEIKNLGNFMYRGTSYPFYLKTKVDYIYANLFGIRPEVRFLDDQIRVEALLNSNLDQYPFFDFSLGLMAYYQMPNKFLDFGAGICFDRIFSVDKSVTECENVKSQLSDTTMNFRSTKLDFRMILDFKPLFGDPSLFGTSDLKLYGELAILGTKTPKYFPNDSLITASVINRMPMMIGINLPCFKILDLLSFETEFCANPYPNDWWGGIGGTPSPEPQDVTDSTWHDIYKNKDNFKWTLYAKKTFADFDIIAIFANDHSIYETRNAETQPATEQTLRTNHDWHWYLKLQYRF